MTATEEPKMRIKLITGLATQRRTYDPGTELDWPESEARRFIEAGYAAPVGKPKETMERADARNAEKR